MTSAPRARQDGFVLAAVLWMLAGLSILVAMISGSAQSSAERVAQLRQRVEFTASAYGARAHLLYWTSVTSTARASFNDGTQHVRADGMPLLMPGRTTVAVQDIGGLLSLNKPNRPMLGRYLLGCGVEEATVSSLIDALEDYTDADDLHRINGAERSDYRAAGLRGPRNAPLRTVGELWSVFGWSAVEPALRANGCVEDFTVEVSVVGLNLATAPNRILVAAGLPQQLAGDLVQSRSDMNLLTTQMQLASGVGGASGAVDMFGMAASVQVQRKLVVTHRQIDGPWAFRYTLHLTADKDGRPWNIIEPTWAAAVGPASIGAPVPWPEKPPAAQSPNAANSFPF